MDTGKWSTERESNSREVSLSDLQSEAFTAWLPVHTKTIATPGRT
jgi:hypothetical protein